jgi:hypothetical protein
MSRYTLKTYYKNKQLEVYNHRAPAKLKDLLIHPRFHRAGEVGPWGEEESHPDRFEIFDSLQEKIFTGTVEEALSFIGNLK